MNLQTKRMVRRTMGVRSSARHMPLGERREKQKLTRVGTRRAHERLRGKKCWAEKAQKEETAHNEVFGLGEAMRDRLA